MVSDGGEREDDLSNTWAMRHRASKSERLEQSDRGGWFQSQGDAAREQRSVVCTRNDYWLEFTSHSTQNRSFRRRCSQSICWLVLNVVRMM